MPLHKCYFHMCVFRAAGSSSPQSYLWAQAPSLLWLCYPLGPQGACYIRGKMGKGSGEKAEKALQELARQVSVLPVLSVPPIYQRAWNDYH